ncbi:MAG TPA: GTPase [archaeon]|nr:GTPase [archaeon]
MARKPSETYFPKASEILEQAFSTTSQVSVNRKGISPLKVVRLLNALKIQTFGVFLQGKLHEISKQLPKIDSMDPFYLDLIGILADTSRIKQNLARVRASSRIIKRLRYMYGREAYIATSIPKTNAVLNTFQGRASSVIKKLAKPLGELKEDSKKLRELPSIDFTLPTVVIAGYPNVGKTTILKRLTGASATIAPYQFTTKQLNSGFYEHNYQRMQVLDTPGILDREDLSAIEKKALAAIQHLARVIVFIMDPTLACGYTLSEQLSLFHKTKQRFSGKHMLVIVNKADSATEEEMEISLKALEGNKIIIGSENDTQHIEQLRKEVALLI